MQVTQVNNSRLLADFYKILVVALLYWITAKVGMEVAALPGKITPIWIPSGLMLAVILLFGYKMLIGGLIGSLIAETHELTLMGFAIAADITFGNMFTLFLIAFIVKKISPQPHQILKKVKELTIFILIIFSLSVINATNGVIALYIWDKVNNFAVLQEIMWTWWLSDFAGMLIFAPLILAWYPRPNLSLIKGRYLEIAIFCVIIAILSWLAFYQGYAIEYLYLPLLMWSTFRFGQSLTILLAVIIVLLAIIATVSQLGPFIRESLINGLILLQTFMGSIIISTLYLSVVIQGERKAHEALEEINQNLEKKVTERTIELEKANQAIQALNQNLKEENLRMTAELDITREFQKMILPKEYELQKIPDLEIAGFMQPATEVGGDYYDVLHYGDNVKIAIGDVTGHGLASGMLMLMVQTAVRTLFANNVCTPEMCLTILNRAIYDNVQRMNSDKNLTLALIDYHRGKIQLSGQHEEILLVRQGGNIECIDTIDLGFPIGLTSEIDDFVAHVEIELKPGDGVVLYTDGVTEAENAKKEMYGLPRLCDIVSQNWQKSAKAIQEIVISDLQQHIQDEKIYDDITLLILKQR